MLDEIFINRVKSKTRLLLGHFQILRLLFVNKNNHKVQIKTRYFGFYIKSVRIILKSMLILF